jgi:hypothetical protein
MSTRVFLSYFSVKHGDFRDLLSFLNLASLPVQPDIKLGILRIDVEYGLLFAVNLGIGVNVERWSTFATRTARGPNLSIDCRFRCVCVIVKTREGRFTLSLQI